MKIKGNTYPEVPPSKNKEIYKGRILTSLFKSGIIKEAIKGVSYKNGICYATEFYKDAIQETFLALCMQPAEKIIRAYEYGNNRLVAFATIIGIHKCVTHNVKYPDYPKHSLATLLFHTSNLKQLSFITPTDYEEESLRNHEQYAIIDEPTGEDSNEVVFNIIEHLSNSEVEELKELMYSKNLDVTKHKKLVNKVRGIYTNKINKYNYD